MNNDVENPWAVNNLEEFLYFCCPECDERNQSKELFFQHALTQHPNSKTSLENLKLNEEILNIPETINYSNNPSDLSYQENDLNCDIKVKEEFDNQEINKSTLELQSNI